MLVCAAGVALAATCYVSTSGSDANDGSSWGTAYRTITFALGSGLPAGSIINVGTGEYTGSGPNAETFPLDVPADLRIKGISRGLTTIEGTPAGVGIDRLVKLAANSTLEGFTVRVSGVGAGGHRTAVYLGGVGSALVSSEVSDSLSSNRGNVYVGYGQTLLRGNIIRSAVNTAGVVVSNFLTSASLDGTLIICNEIRDNVAGVYLAGIGAGETVTINKNTIANNGNGLNNWGINMADGGLGNFLGTAIIKNNIIWASVSSAKGIGRTSAGGTATSDYNDVNGVGTRFTGVTEGAQDLNANPKFVGSGVNNFHLYDNSPCSNEGEGGIVIGAYDDLTPAPPVVDKFVSPAGNNTDGNSWATAFHRITTALASIETGHTVHVGTGEYTNATETFPLAIPAGVTLEGVGKGYATIEAALAGMFDPAVTLANGSAIKGCTIFVTGSGGNKNYLGIYVTAAENCRISEMTIYGNERFANFGGPEINAGILAGSLGAPASAGNLSITSCEIRDIGSGIGIVNENGVTPITINKNTIVGCLNGVISVTGANTNTYNITNTIIASCETSGVMQDCGTINFSYNNTWEAAPALTGGTFNPGSGNISADPLFVNKTAKDFRLSWANYPTVDGTKSPCIDTGTPAGTDIGAYDFIPPSGGPINQPTNFSGSAESTTTIRWNWRHDGNNLLGFRLLNESGATLATLSPATSVSTVEGGLAANTQYQRTARAYNSTSSADATAARFTWADVPTALAVARQGSTEVDLTWLGNGTSYRLDRSFDGTSFSAVSSAITALNYTDTRLLPNKQYWYRVSAFNGDGIMTAPSLTVLATTGAYTAGPIIRYATASRRQIREGDVVSSRPLIGAIVESTVGFDPDSLLTATFTRISDGTRNGPYSVSTYARHGEGTDLFAIGWNHGLMSTMEAGEYWLDLLVTDTLGNTGTLRVKVKIYSATGGTTLIPGTEPTADKSSFDPTVGESATILYSLTTPANVQIIGYGPTAKMAFNLHFAADRNGGLAGTNSEAKWDGREPGGAIAGKGIYVYRIIANGKAIGKGYLVVK
jgi:hypothetical protein